MSDPAMKEMMLAYDKFFSNQEEVLKYVNHRIAVMDYEVAMENSLERGREAGLKAGREQGRKEGREEGRKEGRKEGREEGRKEGREEGRKEGCEEGRKEEREQNFLSCVKNGISVELSAKSMGLSPSEVAAIMSKHPELNTALNSSSSLIDTKL